MSVKRLVRCALIAALYASVSLALTPLSYGPLQVRISEALTLLPVLCPDAILGVTLGCFLTNLVGLFTGANLLGGLDLLFGTGATLLAALLTYALRQVRLKGIPAAAALPPVLCNAVIIGAELAWVLGPRTAIGWLLQGAGVGLGELVACFVLGLPLIVLMEKRPALRAWLNTK